jgi:tyrosyl-tRNA synthetase
MDLDKRVELAERNISEVITREELRDLLERKRHPMAYVGYEPSGKIHLGHVLTINKLRDLQEAGFEITVLLADIHAYLNRKGSLEDMRKLADYNKECFIALGLEEDKARFVLGSEIQLRRDYFLDVQRLALETTLLRAKRSMDLVGRKEENPRVARVLYPLMQVVDMVALGVDVAVGGMDQRKIHMLARDNLPKLGYSAPVCIHTPIIHGLDGADKMSSSLDNFIAVDDSPEEIKRKLRKAFCPIGEAVNNPVMELYQHLIFPRYPEVVIRRPEKYGGDLEYRGYGELEADYVKGEVHPQDLKESAAGYLTDMLSSVREYILKKPLTH